MLRTPAALALAALALAGCGGEGGDATTTASRPRITATADLPSLVRCTNYNPDSEPQMFATGSGDCERDGTEVYVATFSTSASRDQWVRMTATAGGVCVVGDGWAAWTENADIAKAVARDSGGEVVE